MPERSLPGRQTDVEVRLRQVLSADGDARPAPEAPDAGVLVGALRRERVRRRRRATAVLGTVAAAAVGGLAGAGPLPGGGGNPRTVASPHAAMPGTAVGPCPMVRVGSGPAVCGGTLTAAGTGVTGRKGGGALHGVPSAAGQGAAPGTVPGAAATAMPLPVANGIAAPPESGTRDTPTPSSSAAPGTAVTPLRLQVGQRLTVLLPGRAGSHWDMLGAAGPLALAGRPHRDPLSGALSATFVATRAGSAVLGDHARGLCRPGGSASCTAGSTPATIWTLHVVVTAAP